MTMRPYAEMSFEELDRRSIRTGYETEDNRIADAELKHRGFHFNASEAGWELASRAVKEPDAAGKEDPVIAARTRQVMEEIRACSPNASLSEVPTLFAFGPIYRAISEAAEGAISSPASQLDFAGLKKDCGHCRGRGVVTRTYDDYGMADPKDEPCWYCAKVDRLAEMVTAEHTRAVLRYTVKGYTAGENTDAKHWRERAEKAEQALAEVSSPATPQVSNYVTESAARFKKFCVPVTYESRDGDTLAVRMCKKIYNLTALAKFHDTPIGPDELRTINSAAFAGMEGEDEITEGAASPATPALEQLIAKWRASADWMMGSTNPDEWQRGGSAYLRQCAGDLALALADVARTLPASQEEK